MTLAQNTQITGGRPYVVSLAQKTQIMKNTENWGQKTQITGGSGLQGPTKKCTNKKPGLELKKRFKLYKT